MSKRKNKYSVSVAIKGNHKIYLSSRDEQNGLDIRLDMQGYTIISL